jgi:hypothetical protein
VSALRDDLDLRRPLAEVDDLGGTLVEHALEDAFRAELEAATSALPFRRLAAEEGRARQGGDYHALTAPFGSVPAVQLLADDLVRHVHAAGAGAGDWVPNEVYVQRYRAGDLGITPHLDLKRYRYLVAVFTASGEAECMLCKNRAGDVLRSWLATAGSLVLLRAPGFADVDDGRLLHAVRGPAAGERISVSYRFDSRRASA